MTDAELAELVTRALYQVAPDIEGEDLDPDVSFAEQFEVDSMDLLNLVVAVHNATGLDIPEADQPNLTSLAGSVAYLRARLET
jgi:acyl carrier protein